MPPTPSPLSVLRALNPLIIRSPRAIPLRTRASFQPHSSRQLTSTTFSAPLPSNPKSTPADTPSTSRPHDPRPKFSTKPQQPSYDLTFTCKPCSTRSTHRISKQGYHYGSVLITCPECRNRHVISDHLTIFGDRNMTVEDLMRERGQLVKKGTLSEDGDLEFWEDGSVTKRKKEVQEAEAKSKGEDAATAS